jgi:hypothetical protein
VGGRGKTVIRNDLLFRVVARQDGPFSVHMEPVRQLLGAVLRRLSFQRRVWELNDSLKAG